MLLSSEDCPEKCEAFYNPVCGSNGETYKNICRLSRENCLRKKDKVIVVHEGECLVDEKDETEEFRK